MVNKLILVSVLIVLVLCVSGCTDEQTPESGQENANTTNDGNSSDITEMSSEDLAVIADLPEGYEYLGSPSLTAEDVQEDYVNSSGVVAAAEGLYKVDSVDLYVDVIEFESPELAEEFVSDYISSFDELPSGTRFEEDSFNGHSVTRIKTYATVGGEDVARYTYVWSNENFVFVVGGATDDYSIVRTLAEATGY
ncbi:hypothetical protein V7O62_07830 [Methanolobus sp. ZRKC2]|uniref:hypothetical protein n=1 Tax=Methanolobus sp. ZRKC2 TaxID=3125783 RepID=UPI0032437A92